MSKNKETKVIQEPRVRTPGIHFSKENKMLMSSITDKAARNVFKRIMLKAINTYETMKKRKETPKTNES